MYDLLEVQHHNDILFKYLRRELHYLCFQDGELQKKYKGAVGIGSTVHSGLSDDFLSDFQADLVDEKKKLHRPSDQSSRETENVWSSANMFFSQICGYPFSTDPAYKHLCLIGSPSYEGCQPGVYRSYIIVKKSKAHLYKSSLASLAGARLAINHATSYSGSVALVRALFDLEIGGAYTLCETDVSRRNIFHPSVLVTGAHRESVRAVATRSDVDCAAIDCVTFSLLPHAETEHVVIVGETTWAPAPPFVCAHRSLCPVFNDALESVLNGRPQCINTLGELAELQKALAGLRIVGYTPCRDRRSTFCAHFTERSEELAAFSAFDVHNEEERTFFYSVDACGYHFDYRSTSLAMSKHQARWFDRGMLLVYNFNHVEARRCFEQILKENPLCSMAHWGMAYASGVYYNNIEQCTMEDMERACAHAHRKAGEGNVDEDNDSLERWLTYAIQARAITDYGGSDSDKREQIYASNMEYARRMKQVYERFPAHPDVSALYAESMMNLRPWKLWPPKSSPMSTPIDARTLEIQRVLEAAIASHSPHPGLAHFYVHLMELAPEERMVAKAVPQSNLLRSQWPACGHLLHMASHIDMQFGDYERGIRCNWAGIQQDKVYAALRGSNNYYHGYRIHNHHMLVWAAMFAGKFTLAMEVANEARRDTPPAMLDQYIDWMEPYLSDIWMIMIRFGKWAEILERPFRDNKSSFPVWYAWDCYAKALAFSALGKIVEAESAVAKFHDAVRRIPPTRYLHNVTCSQMFEIASEVLAGELAYRQGHVDVAFAHLQKGVCLDDNLPYDEPWGWTVPVRHALGALLCEAGGMERVEAAIQVYEEDLRKYPGNVWSLIGLNRCYKEKKLPFPARLSAALDIALSACDDPENMRYSCFCAGQRANVDGGGAPCGCSLSSSSS